MLPKAREGLCALLLQRLCLRGEQRSRSAQKSKRKTAGNVSFGRFLALYFCHKLADRVIEFSHVFRSRRLSLRKRNELLKSGELFAYIFHQRLLTQFRRDCVKL